MDTISDQAYQLRVIALGMRRGAPTRASWRRDTRVGGGLRRLVTQRIMDGK